MPPKRKLKKKVKRKKSCGCSFCDYLVENSIRFYRMKIPPQTFHNAHGCHLSEMKFTIAKPRVVSFELPDLGKLKAEARYKNERLVRTYVAAPHYLYPPPPKIKLEGIRAVEVLRWAEQWRDHYESRRKFLTIGALRGMVQHSGLPSEDHVDVDMILRVLYADEISLEVNENRLEIKRVLTPKPEPKPKIVTQTHYYYGIPIERRGPKVKIFDIPVSDILRWMGQDAWNEADARTALNCLCITDVQDRSISAQIRDGRTGGGLYGTIPILTTEQDSKLNALVLKPERKNDVQSSAKQEVQRQVSVPPHRKDHDEGYPTSAGNVRRNPKQDRQASQGPVSQLQAGQLDGPRRGSRDARHVGESAGQGASERKRGKGLRRTRKRSG